MVTVSHEGYVCGDCMSVIANGDTSGIEDLAAWEKRVKEHNATEDGKYHVVPADEDDDPRFSTMGCDFCGNKDHMDVRHVAFLTTE